MAPFLGKGPAITKEERALLRSEAEKDPTFIGRLGEFLEGLGESVGGEKEEMASGGVVGYQDGGYVNRGGDRRSTLWRIQIVVQ